MECLTNDFRKFLAEILKFVFWETAWALAIKNSKTRFCHIKLMDVKPRF